MHTRFLKIIVVLTAGLLLYAAAPAGAAELQKWMHDSRTTVRLMKLDRTDGFLYGLSVYRPGEPDVLLAPGSDKTWLLQIAGAEAVLQPDDGGSLQVIQADEDVWIWVCWLKQITTYLTNVQTCTTRLCRTDKFLTLLISLNTCVPIDTDD